MDLGTFNPNVVAMEFSEQPQKWEDMTKDYISRVILMIHRFIAAALRSVYPVDQARRYLWFRILDDLLEGYKMAMNQANLLIEVERHRKPYTLN